MKILLAHTELIEKKLRTKDPTVSLGPLLAAYEQFTTYKSKSDDIKARINHISKEIGEKIRNEEDSAPLKEKVTLLKKDLENIDTKTKSFEEEYISILTSLPNIPFDEIPVSLDPKDNVCVKTFKEKPSFSFQPLDHLQMGEKYDLFSLEQGSKITGSGWPVYKNGYARLELALIQMMIDIHLKNGFSMISPPHVVTDTTMFGSGQLPKFRDQVYQLKEENLFYLIPTAEVPLTGIYQDTIFEEHELPKFFVSYTPCFRREAGSYGKSERGLIRIHQFNKVELYAIVTEDTSNEAFDKILASAEEVLQTLDLHYRNMLLVTGDMSFGSAKTIDIEVWLPGQDRYYEVSSVSNCTDFQARRSKIRYKRDGKTHFVHTLNGSGLALPRLMIALLENCQNAEGIFSLPHALEPYLPRHFSLQN